MKRLTAALTLPLLALAALGSVPAAAAGNGNTVRAALAPIEGANVTGGGVASATVRGDKIDVQLHADGLFQGKHAVHIHHDAQAAHECPTLAGDDGSAGQRADGILNTVEGLDKYGNIAVSLTTSGGTGPTFADALALDRFLAADADGELDYSRSSIPVSEELGKALRSGQGVVVVHGVDQDGNGEYGFEGAGESELASGVPAEVTNPALCGVLR